MGGEVLVNQKNYYFSDQWFVPKAQKIMMTDLVRIGLRFKQVIFVALNINFLICRRLRK